MNELKIFENPEFGTVRTVLIDGEPWFVGIDVAKALGYSKAYEAIRTNTNKEDTTTAGISDANNHTQQMVVVNESGLYDMVFGSRLPKAKELHIPPKQFTNWLAEKGYIYRDRHGMIKPYEQHRKNGLFQMKDFSTPFGYSNVQTYITIKGKETFRLLIGGYEE